MQSHHPDQAFAVQFPDVETVDIMLADSNGVLRGKRTPIDQLEKVITEGILLPRSIFGNKITGEAAEATELGDATGDRDYLCQVQAKTLAPCPWQPKTAQLLSHMVEANGSGLRCDPRTVLTDAVTRLDSHGYSAVVAVELEFYLLDVKTDAQGQPQPPISPDSGRRDCETQVYSFEDLNSYGDFLALVQQSAQAQNIPATAAIAEFAPGQFEINLQHINNPVLACEQALLLKRIIKGCAKACGYQATFMAKPYQQLAGSGMHVHISVLDQQGNNIFSPDVSPLITNETINPAMRQALSGLITTMQDSLLAFAPHANSYHRIQPGSFVPINKSWGHNNRTVALRIPLSSPSATRIEYRIGGADANPFVVMACIINGICYGFDHGNLPLPSETELSAYKEQRESIACNWKESVHYFQHSEFIHEYLGAEFQSVYSQIKTEERLDFERHISQLEYDWYQTLA
ncbi:Gamma-glutamylputrescine synthetase PuuA [Sinobacterium norvegicum]|uniref:Gamma-glutamylputrescine synthetase PuuA n=1 Tax=Sinobacterium norvegicum TaxID=1641715 RepID=A0ABM9AA17_9GAMM|nr:glutamine synthetase family protein [Sinobacterium norvegicum]CAH0990086.1 Gamma-glutamylputrescine synthetase PuuA [Sinobacterium norvegicum]